MTSSITIETPLLIPDPDAIRAAIDITDERARLLRRLLRVAMRLRLPLVLAIELPATGTSQAKAVNAHA